MDHLHTDLWEMELPADTSLTVGDFEPLWVIHPKQYLDMHVTGFGKLTKMSH